MRIAVHRLVSLAAACLVVASPTLAPATSEAAGALPCRAHMSDSTPADYSTVRVMVKTAPGAHVRTVAHYKTTDTVKTRPANEYGSATVPYDIYSATPGYPVPRQRDRVQEGPPTRTCSTSFTPHR